MTRDEIKARIEELDRQIIDTIGDAPDTMSKLNERQDLRRQLVALDAPPADKPLDLTKPVQTRDGRAVRILCTDAKNARPIVGIVTGPHVAWQTGLASHGEEPHSWYADGRHTKKGQALRESPLDLINVPPRDVTMWVNVYYKSEWAAQHAVIHRTKESAARDAGKDAITVPITFTPKE